jgi:hypothetical protein
MSTFREISKTFARATGFIAGPESPPLTLNIFGFLVKILKAVPTKVFIADTASPPSSFTICANSEM